MELVTLILEKARGTLDLRGPRNTFPIADVGLFDGSQRPIEPVREHGALGAERTPDIILMRKAAMPLEGSGQRVHWTDVLSWFELKFDGSLRVELNRARAAHGLPPRVADDEETLVEATVVRIFLSYDAHDSDEML